MNPVRKIANIHAKLSVWGVKGAIQYLLRKIRKDPMGAYFADNARKHPYPTPELGITIIGPLTKQASSLSHVLRDFAFSLKDAGIPFQTFDTGPGETPESDTSGILTPISEFRIRRFSNVIENISRSPLPEGIVPHRAQIMFWEFQEGILDADPGLSERTDSIIAMSDFNYRYFCEELKGITSVFKILYPMRIDVSGVMDKQSSRVKFGLGQEDFVVFYNFNYTSGWMRKNPAGVILAFAKALPAFSEKSRLVLKTSNSGICKELEARLVDLAKAEGVQDHIVWFNEWMPQKEIYDLTNACDVYLSLNRGEGFGLGIAEAMCLSKAVVCTDYGAPAEFCKTSHAIMVPYQMSAIPPEERSSYRWYRGVHKWAEPDMEAAADALVRLQRDKSLRFRLGQEACRYVRSTYSIDRFRESVFRFLEAQQDSA